MHTSRKAAGNRSTRFLQSQPSVGHAYSSSNSAASCRLYSGRSYIDPRLRCFFGEVLRLSASLACTTSARKSWAPHKSGDHMLICRRAAPRVFVFGCGSIRRTHVVVSCVSTYHPLLCITTIYDIEGETRAYHIKCGRRKIESGFASVTGTTTPDHCRKKETQRCGGISTRGFSGN